MTTYQPAPSMPMPEWADEAKGELQQALSAASAPFKVKEMEPITDFSTHFAEYFAQGDDFVVHLFPRNGSGDRWEEGHYIPRCRSCRSEISLPKGNQLKPCPRCGHAGLVYIPGRKEEKATVVFPGDMRDRILKAADANWMGDVAIDLVVELGAYAVQFQGAKATAGVVGYDRFADGFCSMLDEFLEE